MAKEAAEQIRLEERAGMAALLLHVAEQYKERRQLGALIAQIVAGCGNAVVAGIHMLPPERWPKMSADNED